MSRIEGFRQYIAAFNRGDIASYSRFYAPDVQFRNGAGAELVGAAAIVEYYEALKPLMAREIEVRGVTEGTAALAAALRSRFVILRNAVEFAGELLNAGDRVLIDSIALYEFEGGKFAAINSRTIERQIERQGGGDR